MNQHTTNAAQPLSSQGPESASSAPPRIGEYWIGQGGIYAGIVRNTATGCDEHLIVGPAYEGAAEWQRIDEWTRSLSIDGHADFGVMRRSDGWICRANVPELFEAEWYWLEQHASRSSYAWSQSFGYGGQGGWRKYGKLRARAVRRLVIQ